MSNIIIAPTQTTSSSIHQITANAISKGLNSTGSLPGFTSITVAKSANGTLLTLPSSTLPSRSPAPITNKFIYSAKGAGAYPFNEVGCVPAGNGTFGIRAIPDKGTLLTNPNIRYVACASKDAGSPFQYPDPHRRVFWDQSFFYLRDFKKFDYLNVCDYGGNFKGRLVGDDIAPPKPENQYIFVDKNDTEVAILESSVYVAIPTTGGAQWYRSPHNQLRNGDILQALRVGVAHEIERGDTSWEDVGTIYTHRKLPCVLPDIAITQAAQSIVATSTPTPKTSSRAPFSSPTPSTIAFPQTSTVAFNPTNTPAIGPCQADSNAGLIAGVATGAGAVGTVIGVGIGYLCANHEKVLASIKRTFNFDAWVSRNLQSIYQSDAK